MTALDSQAARDCAPPQETAATQGTLGPCPLQGNPCFTPNLVAASTPVIGPEAALGCSVLVLLWCGEVLGERGQLCSGVCVGTAVSRISGL